MGITVVVQVKKLGGFLVLLAAFLVAGAGAAGEEQCHYVVDVEIARNTDVLVKFEVSNSAESGASWTQERQVRADSSNSLSTCVDGYYQFVTKNLCANPCHLGLTVLSVGGILPISVRIRGYPSQEPNPAAPKYDHLFSWGGIDLFESDVNDC